MLNRFMISVAAAALVAGTGLANAQGTMGRDSGGGAGGAQMQQSQPSGGAAERGGAMGRDSMSNDKGSVGQAGGSSSMEKSGAMKDERSSGGAMNKNAADDKAGATKEQRTDDRAQGQMDKSKSSDSTTKSGTKDMKAEDNKAGGAAKSNNAENRPASTDSKSQTTGNASATAAAPPAEKRTEISSAIKSTKIEETTNVNFNISVGTAIPASVRVHPLPPRIVEIYPQWRGYEVIFVRGQYVIVRPQTREIVYIIEG